MTQSLSSLKTSNFQFIFYLFFYGPGSLAILPIFFKALENCVHVFGSLVDARSWLLLLILAMYLLRERFAVLTYHYSLVMYLTNAGIPMEVELTLTFIYKTTSKLNYKNERMI